MHFYKQLLLICVVLVLCLILSSNGQKLRFCIVDGKGGFKRTARYCPILDEPDSKVRCVIGLDRLDCLRKIQKNKADFAVFNPEDLVAATNSEIEVLLTNELRFTEEPYEYQVVAVVKDESGIKSRHDLRGKTFCHPGYGYETDWTNILSNYLEASVIPQECNSQLSLTENHIRASSNFFQGACKPGPWVHDAEVDQQLKQKYPNLCRLCEYPHLCAKGDKYWGRRGSLFCLTDSGGDVSWSRWDDVQAHFGLKPGSQELPPDGFSLLCPDGNIMPVNTTKPCFWVVKPWPVVASARTKAMEIQEIVSQLSELDGDSWHNALVSLIESYHVTIKKLEPVESIEGFLNRATGFLSANSFAGCHPPRQIRICTTSNIETHKCSWLRETAQVYGIEPNLECLKADNVTHCMEAISNDVADLVMVQPDFLATAINNFNLTPVFYETTHEDNQYLTVAVTKSKSNLNTFKDLEGSRACFPTYDGIAWNSMVHELRNRSLIYGCPQVSAIANYFGPSCVPNVPLKNGLESLSALCDNGKYAGDVGALRCVFEEKGDVAFVSKNVFDKFVKEESANRNDYKQICDDLPLNCHLSWSPVGQAMIRKNSSNLWIKDTLDLFAQLDLQFGKNFKSLTSPFSLYGAFDGRSNILFHDATLKLRNVPTFRDFDIQPRFYKDLITDGNVCSGTTSLTFPFGVTIIIVSSLLHFRF